jgi:hypothetical protein
MADNIIGGGGNSVLQNLIQNAANNQAQQNQAQTTDDGDRDALHARLIKQLQLKQQRQQDHIAHDHLHQKLHRAAIDKRMGPGVAEWAGSEALQKKLNDRQKQLFLAQAAAPATEQRANAAGQALSDLSQAKNFAQAAPTAQAAGDLQAALLDKPERHPPLRQAIDSRFMGDKNSDGGARQGLLRFAARYGDTRGISVRLGADMLGTLSGTQVPGFAQRAAIKMMERNPDNAQGVSNLDAFAQDAGVRAMPSFARGQAVKVLAQGDGTDGLREGLGDIASESSFRSMSRADKAQLFATIGQGRASQLRAITDQTLAALRTAGFPAQSAQVSRFLGGLGRQIRKGDGSAKEVDGKGLIRQAKKGTMPALPKLMSTTDTDDEEAQQQARSHNRAALMRYYSQLGEHYAGIETQIKNAKYFEDVNLLTGLREAKVPDTSALKVADGVRDAFSSQLDALKGQLDSRELKRPEYVSRVKALQAQALGRADLSADEKTWVSAVTSDAQLAQTYLELAGKKNRKLREVGKNLMPPAKRRRLAQERRNVGAQPRYFRPNGASDGQSVARMASLPMPQRQAPNLAGDEKAQIRQLISVLTQALRGDAPVTYALQQLGRSLGSASAAKAEPQTPTAPAAPAARTTGKEDAWGIPRTFERDLGAAAHVVPVRPAKGNEEADDVGEVPRSQVHEVQVVRPSATLRDLGTLYALPWKQLSRDESNVFRNLGWDHATWDAKGQDGARWPVSYRTPYNTLSPKQRGSVQALGFGQTEWDAYIEGVRNK